MNTLRNLSAALVCILFFAPANLTAQKSSFKREFAARDTREPYPDSEVIEVLIPKARDFFQSKSAQIRPGNTGSQMYYLMVKDPAFKDENSRLAGNKVIFEAAMLTEDIRWAWRTVDRVSSSNNYPDEFKDRLSVAELILKKNPTPAAFSNVLAMLRPSLDRAIKLDKYEEANKQIEHLLKLGGRKLDKKLKQQLSDQRDATGETYKKFKELQPALEKLKANSTDKESRQAVGEFYFFDKQDYEFGSRILSLSDNFLLSEISKAYQEARNQPKKLRKLAKKLEISDVEEIYKDGIEKFTSHVHHLSIKSPLSEEDFETVSQLNRAVDNVTKKNFKPTYGHPMKFNSNTYGTKTLQVNDDGTAVTGYSASSAKTHHWYFYDGAIVIQEPGGYTLLESDGAGSFFTFRYYHSNDFCRSVGVLTN